MPRPLGVLTLTDAITFAGGAERVATTLAGSLDRDRFRSWICATRPDIDESVVRTLEAAGVQVLVLDRSGKLDLAAWRPLLNLLRDERIDVLHAHKFGSNVWGVLLGRLARVPVVIAHEHTWSYIGQPHRRFLDRELIGRFADAFVAVSPEDRRRMIEIERVPPDKIELIMNGVPRAAPSGADFRAEIGIAESAPLLVAVGRARAQKAFDLLVDVVAELRQDIPDVRLVIAGGADTGIDEALDAQIERLGLTGTVLRVGRRADVPDVLAAADVAILSSDYEGAPLAVMEYMAAGVPIVSTAVGGVPSLIDDGVEGLLVPPRDLPAMRDAVLSLLRDRDRAAGLGRAAAERHAREFSVDTMIGQVEALYETSFARSARARSDGWRSD